MWHSAPLSIYPSSQCLRFATAHRRERQPKYRSALIFEIVSRIEIGITACFLSQIRMRRHRHYQVASHIPSMWREASTQSYLRPYHAPCRVTCRFIVRPNVLQIVALLAGKLSRGSREMPLLAKLTQKRVLIYLKMNVAINCSLMKWRKWNEDILPAITKYGERSRKQAADGGEIEVTPSKKLNEMKSSVTVPPTAIEKYWPWRQTLAALCVVRMRLWHKGISNVEALCAGRRV